MREEKINIVDLFQLSTEKKIGVCITTNGEVDRNGNAIMGIGTARLAKKHFPDLPGKLGRDILEKGNRVFYYPEYRLITFPVKHRFKERASVLLVKNSCLSLARLIEDNKFDTVYLPKPGCGAGNLSWEDIKPDVERILGRYNVVIIYFELWNESSKKS